MLALAVGFACLTVLPPAAASTPPKTLLVDVAHGTVGGLGLGQSSDAYVAVLGLPDYAGALESPSQQEMLWTLGTSTTTAWSVLRLKAASTAAEFLFAGRFTTPSGDRPGTTLTDFRRHWRASAPIWRIVRNGVTVEYNVPVGRVVFAFDKREKLQAVGLAPGNAGDTLCIIPYLCVASALG
ncbi:MAG: hypothetical protein JO186_09105 [Actinobacteria bacterium]|nr:hypothetical protein [Actinomycetota bacterium]MBV8397068.1 hypothetical protein [Actinomycetota bacterium]